MTRILLVLVALAHTAHADVNDRERARSAFREALRHYNLGEFGDARASFKAAYRAFDDAPLLFDIGQCERQLGLKQEALHSYQAYLRESKEAPNRAEVTHLISVLETALREDQNSRTLPPPGVLASNGRLPLQASAIEDEPPPPRTTTPTTTTTPMLTTTMTPTAAPPPIELTLEPRPHRRRALAIGLGAAAGAVIVAGVIVLGFELGQKYPTAGMGVVTVR